MEINETVRTPEDVMKLMLRDSNNNYIKNINFARDAFERGDDIESERFVAIAHSYLIEAGEWSQALRGSK